MKIAHIPVAVVVNGQRKVIPAGAEMPDGMAEHDVQALLASGALLDDAAAAQAKAAQEEAQAQAAAQFQAARQAAQAAAESIQPETQEPPKAPAKPKK